MQSLTPVYFAICLTTFYGLDAESVPDLPHIATVIENALPNLAPEIGPFPSHSRSAREADTKTKIDLPNAKEVELGEVPYMVLLRLVNDSNQINWCNGALTITHFGNQIVLTTAECVTDGTIKVQNDYIDEVPDVFKANRFLVLAGLIDAEADETDGRVTQQRKVVEIVRHEEWRIDVRHTYADIAILHLERDFTHSRWALPISLPPFEMMHVPEEAQLKVAAWRFIKEKEFKSFHKQKLYSFDLNVITQRACNSKHHDKYGDQVVYAFSSLCAVDYNVTDTNPKGSKVCFWDRGSPGAAKDEGSNTFYLAGIYGFTDFDKGCNGVLFPSHFTLVSGHLWWIRQNSFPPEQKK